ncbi:MAG TPA: tetratricopeptide repeat protein [Candidatus Dormibacteraeota bacterium]|nr:tetratricopeptide repeat protein [Candidatus Dormibacteraeota bacterium]
MKRLALLAVPLFFLLYVTGAARAQQASNAPNSAQETAASESTQPPPMTPQQVALMRADILMARKEYATAADAYKQILKGDRKDSALLNKIGMAYQQIGDMHQAERYYKRAWKFDKHFSNAMNNLGTVEYGRKRYKSAIKDYRRALKVGTDLATIYSNLGFAYCGRKEYLSATTAFSKALAIDPTIFDHRGEFGSLFLERSAPDQATIYFLMARSYAKLGDAKQTAHYLKLARDDGYKSMHSAESDPAFKRVIGDPQVQEIVRTPAPFAIAGRPARN